MLHVPQLRKNKSENDVENIFYQFTEQSAKQVSNHTVLMIDFFFKHIDFTCVPQLEQSKSKDEVINTFYQAGGQQVDNQSNMVMSIAVSDACTIRYAICSVGWTMTFQWS